VLVAVPAISNGAAAHESRQLPSWLIFDVRRRKMKLPLFIAHGAGLLVWIPVLFVSAICLLVAACLKIFQDKSESPNPRRWLAAVGFGVLVLLPFSGAIVSFFDRITAH
jgi:hypothetical protein